MAKGYPDYFGYSTFMQYGPLLSDEQTMVLVPNTTWTTITQINAKGMTKGGYFDPQGEYAGVWPSVRITIDNAVPFEINVHQMWGSQAFSGDILPVFLTQWTYDGLYMDCGIASGITFQNTFLLEFYQSEGANRFVNSFLYYTVVQ